MGTGHPKQSIASFRTDGRWGIGGLALQLQEGFTPPGQ
jgi:hypothetical protein